MDNKTMDDIQELIGDPEKEQALIDHETEAEETKLLNDLNEKEN